MSINDIMLIAGLSFVTVLICLGGILIIFGDDKKHRHPHSHKHH
jgi:hypothetical protein